jgi:hypothetical protein
MAFGNITTLYLPIPGSAGSSLWGTDVRKLLSAADVTGDATTAFDHGTSTSASTRTADPYTTTVADLDQTLYGWAVAPSDMNSVAGALRFYPAGNHVSTFTMSHDGATGVTGILTMYVYRVGPAAGRTRTLLGSNTANVVLPALSGSVTATVTVALGEIVFAVDETIQYSFEFNCTGIVITGRVARMFAGNDGGPLSRVDTPKLGVLADTTGTATGSGAASGTGGKVLGTEGSASGTGTASGTGASRADTTGSASGAVTVTGLGSSVAGTTGTATGTGTASGVLGATGAMTGDASGSGTAAGVLGATGAMTGTATGTGTASGVLGATGTTTGTAAGTATVTGLGSSVAGTVGTASGSGTASGLASIVLGMVGTVSIGADTPDWPVTSPTKAIEGTVLHHETGAVVDGATVRLYRVSDNKMVQSTTSAADGTYSFDRDTDDPYTYVVSADYDDAGTPVHGLSDRGLVPA